MGREIFGALIRFGGTILLVFALFDCFHILAKLLNIDLGSHYPLATDIYAAVFYFVLGVTALAGARWIERLAYGPEKPDR